MDCSILLNVGNKLSLATTHRNHREDKPVSHRRPWTYVYVSQVRYDFQGYSKDNYFTVGWHQSQKVMKHFRISIL